MAFEEVAGQEKLIRSINQTIMANRITHAYLIEGLRGVGKTQFALALGQAIMCLDAREIPCGRCISCKKIKERNHPEFHLINNDGSIKIEDIRLIQKNINIKPYEGNKRVYIILNAERMTMQAQNALLKTLEEPPGHSVIILTTINTQALLLTIVSRCQILKLAPQGNNVIIKHLIKKLSISEEEARPLATFANGLIGRALNLYSNVEFKNRRLHVLNICKKLIDAKTMDILNETDFFINEKDYIEEIIDLFICWYRDILVYKETGNEELIINLDQVIYLKDQSRKIEIQGLREIILGLEEKKQQLRGNVNYALAIEAMLLNIQELAR